MSEYNTGSTMILNKINDTINNIENTIKKRHLSNNRYKQANIPIFPQQNSPNLISYQQQINQPQMYNQQQMYNQNQMYNQQQGQTQVLYNEYGQQYVNNVQVNNQGIAPTDNQGNAQYGQYGQVAPYSAQGYASGQ